MFATASLFLRVAGRNVVRNRRRSLLTVTAISLGLLCLIVFEALKEGLHQEMVRSTVELDVGSLQVHAAGWEPNLTAVRPIADPQRVARVLGGDRAVQDVAPRLRVPALLLAGPRSSTVVLTGVDPVREAGITFLARRVISGAYVRPGGGILLGEELARSLGTGVGGEVTLLLQGGLGRPLARRFPVGGLYRTALASFDQTHVFLALPDAQAALQRGDVVTELVARASGGEVEAVERLRRALAPGPYAVRTWRDAAPDVVQLIELNDATMNLLALIVFAIVALGIANTMTMAIFERFRELGVLMAVGTGPAAIFGMILLEAVVLGGVSSLLGSAAALAACAYLGRYGIDLSTLTSANQYFATSHVLRAHLTLGVFLVANAVTLFSAVAAGLYPAWKAGRLEPVEALRHV